MKYLANALGSYIDVGEYVLVGSPMYYRTRALFFLFKLTLLQNSGYRLTLFEGNVSLHLAVVGINIHKFGAVLSCAGAETVKAERIFVGRAAVVVIVFTACVKLTVNKIPVPSFFLFVISQRNASSVVVYGDAVILVKDGKDTVTVTLSRFVHRV